MLSAYLIPMVLSVYHVKELIILYKERQFIPYHKGRGVSLPKRLMNISDFMKKEDSRFDDMGPCFSCKHGTPSKKKRTHYSFIKCALDGEERPEHQVMPCYEKRLDHD